jgi:drug/metabolite transporter (DMT)-like permease
LFVFTNKLYPARAAAGALAPQPGFGDVFTLAAGFGGFGYILGFFVGVSHQPLATAVLGTVTASGTTFLAMLYGKDAIPNSPRVIPCALISLFVGVALTMEYVTISLGG